jgi:hypothetical protein
MSKLTSRSLAFLFTLTLAGAASARRPPALVEAQAQSDGTYATCGEEGRSTAGYRDMLARVDSAKPSVSPPVAGASMATRKMGDHIVLVCAGGEIHQGSGYRAFPARLRPELTIPQIAVATKLVGSR